MNETCWHLESAYARIGTAMFLRKATSHWLTSPSAAIWPTDAAEFPALATALVEALPAALRHSLYQVFAASFLLAPEKAPDCFPGWLAERVSWQEVSGIEASLESMREWRWTTVAVALAGHSIQYPAKIRQLLVGCHREPDEVPILPAWTTAFLDAEARAALGDAAELARKRAPLHRFFYWPILERSTAASCVHGPSMGLPAMLASISLLATVDLPQVLCSGQVRPDGSLTPVGHLEEKLSLARQWRFAAFMYPATAAADPLGALDEQLVERLPVRTLAEAEVLWLRYASGCAQEIVEFDRLMKDPRRLLEALPDQPDVVLSIIDEKREHLLEVLTPFLAAGTRRSIEAFGVLVLKLEGLLALPNWPRRRTEVILSLFGLDLLQALVAHDAALAFRFSLLKVKHANHCGEIEAQQQWYQLASRCYPLIATHDADDKKLEFMVNKFVGVLHNNCAFSPHIPAEFEEAFQDLVPYLEGQLALKRSRGGGRCVHFALGCYYGTMMQHFAFCGPSHLATVLAFSRKAQDAFGNGDIPQYRDDYLRQHCYLCYAYLDARLFSEAKQALLRYLEVETLGDFRFRQETNPFKHAVLARFMADTDEGFPEYREWAAEHPELGEPGGHPWQLWCYNMGRLEEKPHLKRGYFRRSVELCQASSGATVRKMAMLGECMLSAADPSTAEQLAKERFPFMYR